MDGKWTSEHKDIVHSWIYVYSKKSLWTPIQLALTCYFKIIIRCWCIT